MGLGYNHCVVLKNDMIKKTKISIGIGIGLVVLFVGVVYGALALKGPGEYDDFAKCLADKNVIFYGAFWCPHCQNQKKAFGSSAKYLNYIECSLPSGRGQTQECIDKKIESYPTWEFADDTRELGELTFETLSEKSGCELPLG